MASDSHLYLPFQGGQHRIVRGLTSKDMRLCCHNNTLYLARIDHILGSCFDWRNDQFLPWVMLPLELLATTLLLLLGACPDL